MYITPKKPIFAWAIFPTGTARRNIFAHFTGFWRERCEKSEKESIRHSQKKNAYNKGYSITMKRGIIVLSLLSVFVFAACNKEESGFTESEIRQALSDMEGNYHGSVKVSSHNGGTIANLSDGTAVSRDSLRFTLSLQPIAELVQDEAAAARLREIGTAEVSAGYEFMQMNSGTINFCLHPNDIVIYGGYGAPPTLKIVFDQLFGGDALTDTKFILFNISPTELWINGVLCSDFKQLVYHFQGTCE